MTIKVLIIGGGHNALTAAYYLATAERWSSKMFNKKKFQVQILERRSIVGGAAVTEEFHPGFRNSTASYSVGLLSPEVVRDMALVEEHGLRMIPRQGAHFLPLSASEYLLTTYDSAQTLANIAKLSPHDAEAYPRFQQLLSSLVPFLQDQFLRTPPALSTPRAQLVSSHLPSLLRAAGSALSLSSSLSLFELFTRSAGEFLDDYFRSDALKGMLAFDAITGNYASAYSPGSAYVMLHHVMGQIFDPPGRWGHAVGGMGSITQAMARACAQTGRVQVATDCEVQRVLLDKAGTKAVGVVLRDGTEHHADLILSGVHPRRLFLDLMHSSSTPTSPTPTPTTISTQYDEFLHRMKRYKSGSGSLRINVALSELPRFTCLPDDPIIPQSSIMFSPSLGYIEQAYRDAQTIGYARRPVIEMLTPSAYDDSLAPPGKHVASLFCQHMDPRCTLKEEAVEAVVDTVSQLAPNFRGSIIGKPFALSPMDLEQRFGLVDGDIFHGHLSLAQIWAARPVVGWGGYATPIQNLYLCASGAHPGGGVTGYPGRNSAIHIINHHHHF